MHTYSILVTISVDPTGGEQLNTNNKRKPAGGEVMTCGMNDGQTWNVIYDAHGLPMTIPMNMTL